MTKEEYIKLGNPYEWLTYASELYYSSESIWVNDANIPKLIVKSQANELDDTWIPIVSRPYFLLIALSIENLLKGIIVSENPILLSEGKLDNQLSTHNLTNLSTKIVTLKLTQEERDLLIYCTDAILTWGRYPISKSYLNSKTERIADKKIRKSFLKLYKKLSKMLYKNMQKGWKVNENLTVKKNYDTQFERLPKEWGDIPFTELVNKFGEVHIVPKFTTKFKNKTRNKE